MKSKIPFLKIFLLIIIVGMNKDSNAQLLDSVANENLYKEIAHMDSSVFNAFNNRNIDQFKIYLPKTWSFIMIKED